MVIHGRIHIKMKPKKIPLSVEDLRRRVHYDPVTGEMYVIGGYKKKYKKSLFGYLRITLDGVTYMQHRVAYYFMTGIQPDEVDHINNVHHDNRYENLRAATKTENRRNIPKRASACDLKGVYKHPSRKDAYRSQICVNRQSIHLGVFATKEEAHEAYKTAAVKYFGEFARFE